MLFLNQNKKQKQKLTNKHKKHYIYYTAFAATKRKQDW